MFIGCKELITRVISSLLGAIVEKSVRINTSEREQFGIMIVSASVPVENWVVFREFMTHGW